MKLCCSICEYIGVRFYYKVSFLKYNIRKVIKDMKEFSENRYERERERKRNLVLRNVLRI